jgi:beta-galactosidase
MFFKDCDFLGRKVNIPHTWNASDGQDGGNDYWRGCCRYTRRLEVPQKFEKYVIEFDGVNSSCDVAVNGKKVVHHDGGYSFFCADITDCLHSGENILEVLVDNSPNDRVYPQVADFTFYGGIYRPVRLVCLKDAWFETPFKVSSSLDENSAAVVMDFSVRGLFDLVRMRILDAERHLVAKKDLLYGNFILGKASCLLDVSNIHRWNGLKDPYLYTVEARIISGDSVLDTLKTDIGFRTFKMDPKKGFLLNGVSYPLHGVSKHQDREGKGNAISRKDMEEDIELILECGANAVRLAHYQHDKYVYDLCDRKGLVVWAEIPYMSRHMEGGFDNTISQIKELVSQNWNHPSIICWGLSNEITASSLPDEVYENNRVLNRIVHDMDDSRPTVMAHMFMLEPENKLVTLPDLIAYNLYYGWYLGEVSENGVFLDEVHTMYPDKPLALSEFGADAVVKYQTSSPVRGDFSEQYQADYHEQMCRLLEQRPYLWATFIWNMFDFGADGRTIGEFSGFNRKGLVTADRKTRKDAFYVIKAFYSSEKFVHIASKRYMNRTESCTTVKIYSNCTEVSLYNNGKLVATQKGNNVFEFSLMLEDENNLKAVSGDLHDKALIRHVDEKDRSYENHQAGLVCNWLKDLEVREVEGFYSVFDTVEEVCRLEQGQSVIKLILSQRDEKKEGIAALVRFDIPTLIRLTRGMSVSDMLIAMRFDTFKIVYFNTLLNRISKIS